MPSGRLACPECGADAETAWQDQDELDHAAVEIPDFYGEPEPVGGRRRSWWWILAAGAAVWAALWLAFFY